LDKLEPSTISSIDIPNDLDREILRVLMVEDSAEDSDLIMDTLIKGSGSDAEYLRVDTASEMRLALDQGEWDVILSDHNLPNFPTQEALKVWQDSGHGIPLIIVSNHIGEEAAVALMKAGVHDFVTKENMARLVPAVQRSLLETRTRRQFERTQFALQESEARFRTIAANIPSMIFQSIMQSDGTTQLTYVSEGCNELLGIAPQSLQDEPGLFLDMVIPEDKLSLYQSVETATERLSTCNWEGRIRVGDGGEIKWVNLRQSPRKLPDGNVAWEGIISNVTDGKLAEIEIRRAHQELGELSSHFQTIKERERMDLSREIHDDFGGTLTAIKIDLLWLIDKLPPENALLLEKIQFIDTLADRLIDSTQRIARDLRPGILDYGIVPAIQWQAKEFRTRLGIPCEIDCSDEDIVLGSDLSAAIFRIFQETLTNISKHANATRIKISFKAGNGRAELLVSDNGKGLSKQDRSKSRSFGIRSMQERARFLGGDVRIDSMPGKGVTVIVSIPYELNDSEQATPEQRTLF
jgi:PAS domain S-box-containing protein